MRFRACLGLAPGLLALVVLQATPTAATSARQIDYCRHGAGSDGCRGGRGNDVCVMGPGQDGCHGGPCNDRLYGGAQPDQLYGGRGHDYCNGGPGWGKSHACDAGPRR